MPDSLKAHALAFAAKEPVSWPIGLRPEQTRPITSDAGALGANTRGLGLKRIRCESFGKLNRMPPTFAPRTSKVCDRNFYFHAEFIDSHLGFYHHGDRNPLRSGQAQSGRNVKPRGLVPIRSLQVRLDSLIKCPSESSLIF